MYREAELAEALQQAAEDRAMLRRDLDEARCELRVMQRQLEVKLDRCLKAASGME